MNVEKNNKYGSKPEGCKSGVFLKSQRITISITRKFVSYNFSMDQLDLYFFGGDDLSFDTYLSYKYKWMI